MCRRHERERERGEVGRERGAPVAGGVAEQSALPQCGQLPTSPGRPSAGQASPRVTCTCMHRSCTFHTTLHSTHCARKLHRLTRHRRTETQQQPAFSAAANQQASLTRHAEKATTTSTTLFPLPAQRAKRQIWIVGWLWLTGTGTRRRRVCVCVSVCQWGNGFRQVDFGGN